MEYACERHGASVKRACRLLNVSRTVYRYVRKKMDDEVVRKELRELSEKYKRYGFKKLFQKIRQRNYGWNHKRVYRIYCEMKLNLRRKPKKRLPSREKITLQAPIKINGGWAMDFMSDTLSNGQRFRTVNVLNECNREALGILVARSLPAKRVIRYLDFIASQQGYPDQIRLDNGPENVSQVMAEWAEKHRVKIIFIEPGKPAQNAYIERFNRTYREDILDMYLFTSIEEVQAMTDEWLEDYNNKRPHESLGNLTPQQFREKRMFSTCTLH